MWFDLLLGLIIVWEGIAGFLYGLKSAGLRLGFFAGAFVLSLPFAANSSLYLRPLLEPVFHTSIETKTVAASTGAGYDFLGPWQSVVGVTTTTGMDEFLDRLVSLALNVTSFIFLVMVLVTAYRLVEKRRMQGAGSLGVIVGAAGGLLICMVILTVVPILALAEKGTILATALDDSSAAKAFGPLIQGIVSLIASFFY